VGRAFVATATDTTTGDTSEFSAPALVTNGAPAFATINGPFTFNSNGFGFRVTFQPNFYYRIQATTNLAVSNGWMDVTNFSPVLSPFQFVDPAATNFVRRFYRVVSP
jgi:hypothetical protein